MCNEKKFYFLVREGETEPEWWRVRGRLSERGWEVAWVKEGVREPEWQRVRVSLGEWESKGARVREGERKSEWGRERRSLSERGCEGPCVSEGEMEPRWVTGRGNLSNGGWEGSYVIELQGQAWAAATISDSRGRCGHAKGPLSRGAGHCPHLPGSQHCLTLPRVLRSGANFPGSVYGPCSCCGGTRD